MRKPVSLSLWFRESAVFTAVLNDYFGSDEPLRLLQLVLLRNPEAGPVMPGCGGVRKLRWPDAKRSKGKRGGPRVIYLYVPSIQNVFLMDVYNKDEMEDLSPEHKKMIRHYANMYRTEVIAEAKTKK